VAFTATAGDLDRPSTAPASGSSGSRRSRTRCSITGGTSAYANARGVVVSTRTDSGSDDTITLLG